MPSRRLFESALVLAACLACGAVECHRSRVLTDAQRRGQDFYDRMCAVCHGRAGEGYAADQATALAQPDFLASVSDAYLQSAIAQGRSGTTMSAWSTGRGGPLGPADVDAIVAFIRTWERLPRVVLDERPIAGDPARGADLYAHRCVTCHGERGAAGPSVRIGGRELLASAGNGFLRYAVAHGRPGTTMLGFESTLGEGGVEDVLALVRSWQWPAPMPTPPPPAPPSPVPLPLGPVPLNPHGPEPIGFRSQPMTTPVDTVKTQLDRGARMALLDARAPSDYLGEHIAGAVSVPYYDPDPYIALLPRKAWLVCYCACPHAESGQLAQKLASKGFAKVTVLDEGLGVWRAKKYPTHTGAEP
jgi:cytochrome c oxidase cbb3-type subunit 3